MENRKLCDCGCGNDCGIGKHWIQGHNARKCSEETRNKISNTLKGTKLTPEHIENIRRGHIGLKHKPEAILKMRKNNYWKGKKLSNEIRRKLSLASLGKHRSEETKKKMKLSRKGRIFSAETREKMSLNATKQHQEGRSFCRGVVNSYSLKSRFEIAFALYLNDLNIDWEYEKESYKLSSGKRYLPDFFVKDKLYEVKGWWRPSNENKFLLFKKEYPQVNIEVIDGKFIKPLLIKYKDQMEQIPTKTKKRNS